MARKNTQTAVDPELKALRELDAAQQKSAAAKPTTAAAAPQIRTAAAAVAAAQAAVQQPQQQQRVVYTRAVTLAGTTQKGSLPIHDGMSIKLEVSPDGSFCNITAQYRIDDALAIIEQLKDAGGQMGAWAPIAAWHMQGNPAACAQQCAMSFGQKVVAAVSSAAAKLFAMGGK